MAAAAADVVAAEVAELAEAVVALAWAAGAWEEAACRGRRRRPGDRRRSAGLRRLRGPLVQFPGHQVRLHAHPLVPVPAALGPRRDRRQAFRQAAVQEPSISRDHPRAPAAQHLD